MRDFLEAVGRLLTVALVAAVVVLGAGVLTESTKDRRPPIQNLEIEVLNTPVAAGEILLLRAHREKLRVCVPVTSIRSAINLDTGRNFPVPARVWRGGNLDESFVDLAFDASALAPGKYRGRVETSYPCADQIYWFASEFLFEIVAPD